MRQHYNAFISYRHAPLDIAVASRVQRQLEHFRIPRAIAKATGIRRFERIFRDKEELSLTSDLNDTIQQALAHADFLIVICSRATGESMWVEREIEYFLRTHDRSHVLTVLAEGEPEDVVPKILQYREEITVDENGTRQVTQVPAESLSCDFRMKPGRAKREELPRLAAALLGCSYDELKNRQRRYRTARNTAFVSVAAAALLGLTAYYAWTAEQISRNYEQALYNQSTYLASESGTLLEGGDRLNAMLLAIHALPGETDRPLVPAAVHALAKAANAYTTPENMMWLQERSFVPGGEIDDWFVDRDAGYLACRSGSYVTVWDCETGEVLLSQSYQWNVQQIFRSAAGDLVIRVNDRLECRSRDTFALLWEYTLTGFHSVEACGDCVAWVEQVYSYDPVTFESSYETYVQMISAADGSEVRRLDVPPEAVEQYIDLICASEDGTTLVGNWSDLGAEDETVIVWNTETGRWTQTVFPMTYVSDAGFLPDGSVVIVGMEDIFAENYSFINGKIVLNSYGNGKIELACLNPDGEQRWYRSVRFSAGGANTKLGAVQWNGIPALGISAGNTVSVLAADDGRVLGQTEMVSRIVGASFGESFARCVLANGELATYTYGEDDGYVTQNAFHDGMYRADVWNDVYAVSGQRDQIFLFIRSAYDPGWQQVSGEENYGFPKVCSTETGMAALYNGVLTCYSAAEGKLLWKKELEGDGYAWKLLGTDPADGKLTVLRGYSNELLRIDPANGSAETVRLPYECSSYDSSFVNGSLYYLQYKEDFSGTVLIQVQGGEAAVLRDDLPIEYGSGSVLPSPDETAFLLAKRFLLTEEGQPQELEVPENHTLHWLPDGSGFLMVGAERIALCDRTLEEYASIDPEGRAVSGLVFWGNALFVVYETGELVRYDAVTGQHLSTTELDLSDAIGGIWELAQPGQIGLRVHDSLFVLETETWQVMTEVCDFQSYAPGENKVFVRGYMGNDEYVLGTFPLRSYQELIELGRQELNGLELPDDLRLRYGISE